MTVVLISPGTCSIIFIDVTITVAKIKQKQLHS